MNTVCVLMDSCRGIIILLFGLLDPGFWVHLCSPGWLAGGPHTPPSLCSIYDAEFSINYLPPLH